jgi:signal transduction histidine kinase
LLAEKIAQVYEDGESCVEASFLSKDGSTRPHFFTGKRVMFDGVPCLIGVGIDVTVQKQAQQELEAYAHRLQAVSRQLLEVQENERRMLARELHDSVGQELTALSLNLSIINSVLPGDVADMVRSRLDDSQTLLENTTQHLRNVMIELRPPGLDELGLLPALRDHAQRVAQRSGFVLHIQGAEPQPRLPATTEIALFRIAQEALNNTVKHAQAQSIRVDLHESQGQVRLVVADDGCGFAPLSSPSKGPYRMGMTTMRERAEAIGARLHIESGPGLGTQIVVELMRASLPSGLAELPI